MLNKPQSQALKGFSFFSLTLLVSEKGRKGRSFLADFRQLMAWFAEQPHVARS
jgi:hypothetical protein